MPNCRSFPENEREQLFELDDAKKAALIPRLQRAKKVAHRHRYFALVMQAGIALVGTEFAYEIACNRAITIPIYRAALPVSLRETSHFRSRRSLFLLALVCLRLEFGLRLLTKACRSSTGTSR